MLQPSSGAALLIAAIVALCLLTPVALLKCSFAVQRMRAGDCAKRSRCALQAHAAPAAGVEERSLLFAYRQQQQPQSPDPVPPIVFSVGDRVILQVCFRIQVFPSASPLNMRALSSRDRAAASRACQPRTQTAATLWSYLSFEMSVRDAKRWQAAALFTRDVRRRPL